MMGLTISQKRTIKYGNSYTITLPKDWVTRNKVTKETPMTIIASDDSILLLAPKYKPTDREALEMAMNLFDTNARFFLAQTANHSS